MHSVLHCHFESGLRAVAATSPAQLERLPPVFDSPAYLRATAAERLRLLDQQVARLTQDPGIFTPEVFHEVVQQLYAEMTGSGISHVDLRIGVIMRRWPWITSIADAIGAFRAALPGDALTVRFLGAINLSRPRDDLDVIFGRVLDDAAAIGLLAGVDVTLRASDLPALDRYQATLRALQVGGLNVNIHLGELVTAEFSRLVLSRIVPNRIGHGVHLLAAPDIVSRIREHSICLDMCPVSNTRLGVWDWTHSSPAAEAMCLGMPVTINTDDPILFSAGLTENLKLAGLSPRQLETARLTADKYRCQP